MQLSFQKFQTLPQAEPTETSFTNMSAFMKNCGSRHNCSDLSVNCQIHCGVNPSAATMRRIEKCSDQIPPKFQTLQHGNYREHETPAFETKQCSTIENFERDMERIAAIGQISKMTELSRVENASMVPYSPETKFANNQQSRGTIESSWAKRTVDHSDFDE